MWSDTALDGGGVLPCTELAPGTRLRFRLDVADHSHDVTAWVQDGLLHVAGVGRPLAVQVGEVNRLAIGTVEWNRCETG